MNQGTKRVRDEWRLIVSYSFAISSMAFFAKLTPKKGVKLKHLIDKGNQDPQYRALPRQLRLEYPGAIYHLMSRGDRREDIYHDDVGRQDFLKTLAETCQKTGFEVHAYCLMRNHFLC